MNSLRFDAIIIGTGLSGLATAVKLAESGKQIAIFTRAEDPQDTNTNYAQGGIIFPCETDPELKDDIEVASSNTSNQEAADLLYRRGGKILQEVLIDKAQTDFNRDEDGSLKYTKEAAHSKKRIIYRGDYTGKSIQISMLNYLKDDKTFPNVRIFSAHTVIDLLTSLHHGVKIQQRYEENKILGAYVYDQKNNEVIKVQSKFTIMATGGIGAMYLHHTNAEGARGDGHAMARRAGALLINMEFIQFHPTTYFDHSGGRRFLISEAVRGEGGILLNSKGEAFMEKYHPDRELAPRDVVARAIVDETIETNHECVYLDISHKDSDWIINRFPTIYKHCLDRKIDITKEPIPVVPAAHYTCGGIKVDLQGRTTLHNLYAVGEVACTGLHGANRLASTSLLECLTWGYLAAEDIIENFEEVDHYPLDAIKDWELATAEVDKALIIQDQHTIKQTMWNYAGLKRSTDRLKRARSMFHELYDEIQKFYRRASLSDELIGLKNSVETAMLVINDSQRNKESVGCFYRKQ
jgi:L-aspartate oxidase